MLYNGVGWVDKPNVSDGLWACWVFNPTYPLCHFFMHSTLFFRRIACRLSRSLGFHRCQCGGIGRGFADFVQGILIGVGKRRVIARHNQRGGLLIRPRVVIVQGDGGAVVVGFESMLQKGVGTNTVFGAAAHGFHAEGFVICLSVAGGHSGLAARNGEGLYQIARGRLPQPIAHLVVKAKI